MRWLHVQVEVIPLIQRLHKNFVQKYSKNLGFGLTRTPPLEQKKHMELQSIGQSQEVGLYSQSQVDPGLSLVVLSLVNLITCSGQKESNMSVISVLDKIGSDIVAVFKKGAPIVAELQTIATPFENIYAPGLSTLINSGITAIGNAQALAVAAGNTTGSDEVKLAAVISSLAASSGPTLQALGVNPAKVTSAQWTNFVNGLVQAANAFQVEQGVPTLNTNLESATTGTVTSNVPVVLPAPSN